MHFIYNASLAFDQESDCIPPASHTGEKEMWSSGGLWDTESLTGFWIWFCLKRQRIFCSWRLENVFSVSSFISISFDKNMPSFFRIWRHQFQHIANRPKSPESLFLEWGKHNCIASVFLSYVEENEFRENSLQKEQVSPSCCTPQLLVLPSTSRSRGDAVAEASGWLNSKSVTLLAMASSCVAKALFIVVHMYNVPL